MRERAVFDLTDIRVSETPGVDGAPATIQIRGHAAVFNQFSLPLGKARGKTFLERIKPGAFAESIVADDIRALINHDPNLIIGRNRAVPKPTLSLVEDQHGLLVDIDLPDTSYARDLAISMRRGDISQMSFGFEKVKDRWITEKNAEKPDEVNEVRELHKVRLFDVSPVTFPAYPSTDVGVRSADDIYEERAAEPESQEALSNRGYLEMIELTNI